MVKIKYIHEENLYEKMFKEKEKGEDSSLPDKCKESFYIQLNLKKLGFKETMLEDIRN